MDLLHAFWPSVSLQKVILLENRSLSNFWLPSVVRLGGEKCVLFQFYSNYLYSSEYPTYFFEAPERVLETIYSHSVKPKRWCKLFMVIWKFNGIHNFRCIFLLRYAYWENIAKVKHFLRCFLICGLTKVKNLSEHQSNTSNTFRCLRFILTYHMDHRNDMIMSTEH